MKHIRAFLLRLAVRFNPKFGRLIRSAGGSIDKLQGELELHRERNSQRRALVFERQQELREAQAMSGSGPLIVAEAGGAVATTGVFREAIAELELALEDRGWKREQALAATEFSRYGIQQIMLITRLYKIKNPLIRRGIEISALYVFGRGMEISSDDEDANEVIQACFGNPKNAAVLSLNAFMQHEDATWTDGNIFFIPFTDEKTGEVLWRTIEATEIQDIITEPGDHAIPMLYHRRWIAHEFNQETGVQQDVPREAWYPAIEWDAPAGYTVKGQPIEKEPVLHFKVGGLPKWHFGCPLAYPAIDWARSVRRFLENWATITDALAFFSWQVETQGGAPAIAALKQTFATTLANDGTQIETNPTPTSGGAWISGPGNKITPMKTAGATTGPEECRRLVLMLCAAFGWPETFFGDASTGSLATAQSLDRPTELKIMAAQERWREVIQRMGRYVLARSSTAVKGKLKEALAARPKESKKATSVEEITVKVNFPAVLEHDITSRVAAIVEAMTLNGFECTGIDERTGIFELLREIGVEDPQAVIEAMYPEDEYEDVVDRTELMQASRELALNPPAPVAPGAEGPDGAAPQPAAARKPHPKRTNPKEAQLARAIATLTKASEAMRRKKAA